jgi:hypothetical protein
VVGAGVDSLGAAEEEAVLAALVEAPSVAAAQAEAGNVARIRGWLIFSEAMLRKACDGSKAQTDRRPAEVGGR